VSEETGLEVRIAHLVGVYRLEGGLTVSVFRCSIVAGTEAIPDSGEIADVRWFEPDAIPEPTTNILHHALPDIVSGARGVVRDGLPKLN
jgi:ADP-ribose pyrophosphatase YjhB (NUDIX family)